MSVTIKINKTVDDCTACPFMYYDGDDGWCAHAGKRMDHWDIANDQCDIPSWCPHHETSKQDDQTLDWVGGET